MDLYGSSDDFMGFHRGFHGILLGKDLELGAFIFPTINHRSQAGSYELSGTQPYDNLKQFNQFKQPKSGA